MAELLSFEVIGALPIVDAVTAESVRAPGTVQLDPARTIIEPLVEFGLIRPLAAKQAAAEAQGEG